MRKVNIVLGIGGEKKYQLHINENFTSYKCYTIDEKKRGWIKNKTVFPEKDLFYTN